MHHVRQDKQAFIDVASLLVRVFFPYSLASCQIYKIEDIF